MTILAAGRVRSPEAPVAAEAGARRLDVQGLRAVAVLMVVAVHAGLPAPGGFVGVDVFFVISGFVITAMLQREWIATGRLRLTRFFTRRFKRLAPPLAAMLVATILASALALPSGPVLAIATAMGSLMTVANWVIAITTMGYFDAPARMNPLLHTWSLSIEEQFYLVFPLVLGAAWSLSRRMTSGRKLPAIFVAAVAATSLAMALDVSGLSTFGGNSFWFGYFSPMTRAWEFAVGALIVLCPAWVSPGPAVRLALSAVGASALAASLWLITGSTPFPGPWALLPVGGTLLLLISGCHGADPVNRFLSNRHMVMLGDCSYSLYLWHWPFIVVAAAIWPGSPFAVLVAAAVSIVPAAASHRWIEQPLRRLADISARQLLILISATMVPPLLIAIAVGFAANHSYWSVQAAASQHQAEEKHFGETSGCFAEGAPIQRPESCVVVTGAHGPPVYLVGDSSADQFTEALAAATQNLGRSLTSYTSSGCTFAEVSVTHANGAPWMPGCDAYKAGTMAWLGTATPGVVVLSNTDHYLIDPAFAISRDEAAPTTKAVDKAALYKEGLRQQVEAIQAAGHMVMLVRTIPNYQPYVTGVPLAGWRDPTHCPALTAWMGSCRSTLGTPLADFAGRQGGVWETIAGVARDTHSQMLDLNANICADGECQIWQEDRLIYRDTKHLSVRASRGLSPAFEAALGRIVQLEPHD